MAGDYIYTDIRTHGIEESESQQKYCLGRVSNIFVGWGGGGG